VSVQQNTFIEHLDNSVVLVLSAKRKLFFETLPLNSTCIPEELES
jgi:hypothetical protein